MARPRPPWRIVDSVEAARQWGAPAVVCDTVLALHARGAGSVRAIVMATWCEVTMQLLEPDAEAELALRLAGFEPPAGAPDPQFTRWRWTPRR